MTPLEMLRSRRSITSSNPLSRLSRIDSPAAEEISDAPSPVLDREISEISETSPLEPPGLDAAAALMDRLEGDGLAVRVVDGALRVGPLERLTNEFRAAIPQHRDLMVALVESAEAIPAFEVDVLTCTNDAVAEVIRDHPELSLELVLEANDLGFELQLAGPDAISSFRWFARHPAPGFERSDQLAGLLAVRQAAGRDLRKAA